MKVAWHVVPGIRVTMIPSCMVRYDRSAQRSLDSVLNGWAHTVPTERTVCVDFPGTACQATFIQSPGTRVA